jgi:branched-chain amino acid transport system permease protein
MKNKLGVFLFTALLLLVLPVLAQYAGNFWVRIIDFALLYVLLALGLNIVVGYAGLLDLGYIAFYAVGAYMFGLLASPHLSETFPAIKALFPGGLHTPLWVVIPLGAALAGFFGAVLGAPTLKLRGDYLAIVTLGFGEIIRVVILNIPSVGGATGFTDAIPITNFFWIFAMAIMTIAIVRNITVSTFGRALAALRADEIAAEAMGVDTTRYKVLAFVISAALAGVAGGLSGQLFANPLNPQNLNFVKSIEVIVMIVLGGIGSITGAVFGATTLTILPEALRTFDQQFPGLRMVLYALLLILLMIFRPQGLFGRRELDWSWFRTPAGRQAARGGAR